MSGGAMDYSCYNVEAIATHVALSRTLERRALRSLLLKVAVALRAIEWNESGDGDDEESNLIRACLSKSDVLYTALQEAEEMLATLKKEVEHVKTLLIE